MQKVLLESVTFALEKIIHSLLIFLRIDSDGLTKNHFFIVYISLGSMLKIVLSIVMLRGHCVQS